MVITLTVIDRATRKPMKGVLVKCWRIKDYYEGYTDARGVISIRVKHRIWHYTILIEIKGYHRHARLVFGSGAYFMYMRPL